MSEEEQRPTPRKTKVITYRDGSVHVVSIFRRSEVENLLQSKDLAFDLTGWHAFDRGRSFADAPIVFIYNRNVMVTQFRGLDV